MSYIGKNPPFITIPADDSVTSAMIVDGTIVNTDINASAAVAKTKLASLDVVNADINASAAIATSKISGLATSATTDTTDASNIGSGTLANARLDAQLQDIAGLAVTNSGFIVGDGANFVLETGATLRTSVGLGTANDVQFDSFGVGTAASGTTGEIRATNNITAYYSDDRLKDRKGNISDALEKVKSLNGFNYEANETAQELGYEVKPEVGLSAQEVQKVLPEVVVPAPIDDKYLTIHYEKVVPLLVEAIKELSEKVAQLEGN